ncbi:MAG: hypothetical protein HY021_08290 [Burkholderiales bacterium]|nr:hypothetical protein [Burkholderiales bacterium]
MTTTNSRTGRAVLMASHCAGMVDMVALPVWVGTLIAAYGMALGVFAVPFLGATPQIVAVFGGSALFRVFALVMAIAAVLAAFAFPTPDAESVVSKAHRDAGVRLPRAVWFGIFGVSSMALVQAMIFSFVERMGADRGFGVASVSAVLIALGIVNMFPAGLAAVLEKRLEPRTVLLVGPVVQALLALVVSQSGGFTPYAIAAAVFVSVMLFTHTFAFGQLAKFDVTGRAVAATPAMVMIGSALGPIIGGTIVQTMGYGGLGIAALAVDAVALFMFVRMTRRAKPPVRAMA